MTSRGLSQNALAKRVGISQGTVSAWFLKGSIPSGRIALDLARALNVRADWLINGNGDREAIPDTTISEQTGLRPQEVASEWPQDITDLSDATAQLKTLAENMETTNPIGIPGLVKLGRELLDRIEELARATILRKQTAFRESLKRPVEPPTPNAR